MNLLPVLLWTLGWCVVFVGAWAILARMAALDQKNEEEGRVSKRMYVVGFFSYWSFAYFPTVFFDSWAVKLAILIPGTAACVVGARAFVRSIKKQRLEAQKLKRAQGA